MTPEVFDELLESTREALAHARGKTDLRTTALPPAPQPMQGVEVRQLRDRMRASQAVFARYLNVTKGLVSQWERGEKHPRGASLKLLTLIEKNGVDAVA